MIKTENLNGKISDEEIAERKRQLMHRIERHEEKLKTLEDKGKDLSVHGYWAKGYEDGVLAILYEMLDEIELQNKKRINGGAN